MTHAEPNEGDEAPGVNQDARRRVALIANCLLNQNAKVCEGAHYRGVVSPVVQALRSRGYELQQLPCPEPPSPGRDAGGPSMSSTTRRPIAPTAAVSRRPSRRGSKTPAPRR